MMRGLIVAGIGLAIYVYASAQPMRPYNRAGMIRNAARNPTATKKPAATKTTEIAI